jgi:hypothetical protein
MSYEFMPLTSIRSINIRKGKDLKNWWWVLIIGLALAGYGIFDILQIFGILNDEETHTIYVQRLVLPVIPLLLGLYSIYISMRNTQVMMVNTDKKKYRFSLRELVKKKEYNSFCKFLQQANIAWKKSD